MLFLVVVLLVGQLISFMLHFRDRDEILQQVAGYNLMQRIAGMVRILDRLPPAERSAFVRSMDLPPLRVALEEDPAGPPLGSERSMGRTLLHQLLHIRLGEERRVIVYTAKSRVQPEDEPLTVPRAMHEMMIRHMGWPPARPRDGIMVQVQLHDGQWVLFRYRLPSELLNWPGRLLLSLAVLILTVALVSIVAVRWLMRPLSTLVQAADELGRDLHHPPLPEEGPAEVRRAAHAFNTMQRRLSRFVEERTRILAAVSHDLKTPLTRMRLRLEQMPADDLRQRFLNDLDEMQALVQSSLDFMRGIALREEAIRLDVNALVEALCEDIAETGRAVSIRGHADAPYLGRPLALKRALVNLVDNALRYDERPEIDIRETSGALRIAVKDRGPGLPEALLEKVFEPFYRADASRNATTGGSGLGLSIARNMAHALGGELTLRNREDGGLEAVLELPR